MPIVQIEINASDRASDVYKRVAEVAKQTGIDIQGAWDKASVAGDRHSSVIDKLAKLRREDSRENKAYGFIINETSQAVGALALGLTTAGLASDKSSEGIKKFTNVANEGLVNFQGFSFALSALGAGGTLGVAVAALGALALAVAKLGGELDSVGKEKVQAFIDAFKGIPKDILQGQVEKFKADIQSLNEELGKLNPAATRTPTAILALFDDQVKSLNDQRNIDKEIVKELEKQLRLLELRNDANDKATNALIGSKDILGQLEGQIRQQKNISDDVNKSYTERIAASNKLKQLEEEKNALLRPQLDIERSITALKADNAKVQIALNKSIALSTATTTTQKLEIEKHSALESLKLEKDIALQSAAIKHAKSEEILQTVSLYKKKEEDILVQFASKQKEIDKSADEEILVSENSTAVKYVEIEKFKEMASAKSQAEILEITRRASLEKINIAEHEAIRKAQLEGKSFVPSGAEGPKTEEQLSIEKSFQADRLLINAQTDQEITKNAKSVHEQYLQNIHSLDIQTLHESKAQELDIVNEWERKALDDATRFQNELGANSVNEAIRNNAVQSEEFKRLEDSKTQIAGIAAKRRGQIELEEAKKSIALVVGLFKQGIGLLNQSSQQKHEAEISRLEEEKKTSLSSIDEELASTTISEQKKIEHTEQRKKVEAEYNAKIRQEKTEAWKSDKEAKIASAIMATALAVAEALPNIPLSIIVGALGAVQIGLIASQSPPKFHTGGEMFFNAPASKEMPILIRGQETVRVHTPEQEKKHKDRESLLEKKVVMLETLFMTINKFNSSSLRKLSEVRRTDSKSIRSIEDVSNRLSNSASRNFLNESSLNRIVSETKSSRNESLRFTEAQAVNQRSSQPTVQESGQAKGVTVIVNFNSPVPSGEWIKSSIEEGLKRTNLTVEKYLVNQSKRIEILA